MRTKIIELTKDNYEKYIDQVADLEIRVLDNMEKNGKIGQLFITGKEDIIEYIKSKENTVMCNIDENDKVTSAVYITQGQYPYTYNDITKYFKTGAEYENYVKQIYGDNYKMKMITAYSKKLKAYEYAKNKVLSEHPEYKTIAEFLEHEKNSENQFDEKSVLREKLNKYMSWYMIQNGCMKEYEYFYWTTSKEVFNELGKNFSVKKIKDETILEYDNFLNEQQLKIYNKNLKNVSAYFNANPFNSIEIDTYITDPNCRHSGLARILVYEGIKKDIQEHFEQEGNRQIYLCSTLHKENLSSKYVSEFFGLKDNLFVKRRADRDREVHIYKIERENYKQYLNDMEDKLIVLYNYNPQNKVLTTQRKTQILQEQLNYEQSQYLRLNKIRNDKKDYKGSLKDIMPKLNKIGKLREQIKQYTNEGDAR